MIGYLRDSATRLDRAAQRDAQEPIVRALAARLRDPRDPRRGTLARAWRWLPTIYVAESDGDRWQRTMLTLQRRAGDCEDWAIVLAAVSKAAGLDARIATMPGHVVVAVPVASEHPHAHPHGGRAWLFLESTFPPALRARVAPGWGTAHVAAWSGTPYLQIA